MHTAFFSDRERTFALPLQQLEELERSTGCGIGELLFHRLTEFTFFHRDVTETIRLSLIGGGETPQEAAALVAAYVHGRSLKESLPIAQAVLRIAVFGSAAPAGETANG